METFRGKVSKIQRDVEVTGPDYSGDSYTSGSTTDITRFMLAELPMQNRSSRPTYDAISEGDELIVAGNFRKAVFAVAAYKNVTKGLTSYKAKGGLLRAIGVVVILLGIGMSALLFLIGNSSMSLLFSLPFLAAGLFLLYFDYKQTAAIKAIEGYK